MADRIEWALRYISLGWAVLPLRGKRPLTKHGSKDATFNEDQVRDWWAKWPRANLGVATGHKFFALDVDIKKGGEESFDSLRLQHGNFPDTIQQMTGSGGKHLLFQTPGFTVFNSDNFIAPGIDIRGSGGYIVVCPSVHPETKRHYLWDGLKGLEQQPIAAAPGWLLDVLRSQRKNVVKAVPVADVIAQGGRNDAMFKLACSLRRKGLSAAEILATLGASNKLRCSPPLSPDELQTIAKSAERYKPGTANVFAMREPSADKKVEDRSDDWQKYLIRTKNGVAPILANAITALRGSPAWAGVLAFDEFATSAVTLAKSPLGKPGQISDHEDRLCSNWLQHNGVLVGPEIAGQAMQVCAKDRSIHPVRDYLNALRWDGTRRIDAWLGRYLGVTVSDYAAAVGARWLISGVARIFNPGAKADCCLILEGSQGSFKSTSLRTMGGVWFTDELADLGSKDAAMQTRGVWIIEIAELDGLSRAEVGRVKAFMSRTVDRFRPPFGKHLVESPRQCIFSGSVNHTAYLRDETGGRRFWPVSCGRISIDSLARDRDQLWAEAVFRYRAGAPWWLETELLTAFAEEEQADRYEGTAWDALVHPWLEDQIANGRASLSVADVLGECIKKHAGQWTRADEMRMGASLTAAKWRRFKTFKGWRWRPLGELER